MTRSMFIIVLDCSRTFHIVNLWAAEGRFSVKSVSVPTKDYSEKHSGVWPIWLLTLMIGMALSEYFKVF